MWEWNRGMTDYGHELRFGAFITPTAQAPEQVVALAQLAERAGLDLATFQDHPYQPGFLDTWTLLSYVAAATERITLAGNVLNLPLRQPAVLARSAASLDLLSGGRVELGLGSGAFWDAIVAMGGRRLTPGEAVEALEEAVEVIRAVWAGDERGGVRVDGKHYRVHGAKRGPLPAHPIGIWLGAYKPRMLRLTGRVADGWLPSLGYLPGGPADLAPGNEIIDEAAAGAGRDPAAVVRMLNVSGRFQGSGSGLLAGPPEQWAEELAEIALSYGVSVFVLGTDDPDDLRRFAAEVAPQVRRLVAAERSEPPEPSPPSSFPVVPTAAPGERLSGEQPWDESTRPVAPAAPVGHVYSPAAQAAGQHLIDVHDHLRAELEQLHDVLRQVRAGASTVASARSAIAQMTMRQNDWTLGAYCQTYCRTVTQHHTGEDQQVFPHLRASDPGLAPVIDRLQEEHVVIHRVLDGVDEALVDFVRHPADFTGIQRAMDLLTDTLLSHLSYEEQQIVEPLARYGFYAGQV